MKLSCQICHVQFSTGNAEEIGLKELCNQLTQHLNRKHNKTITHMAKDMTELNSILPWFLQMTYYADWGEEKFIDEKYNECMDSVIEILGLETMEDDSQEEECSNKEKEEETLEVEKVNINAMATYKEPSESIEYDKSESD